MAVEESVSRSSSFPRARAASDSVPGRVCSLDLSPRKARGFRLDLILADFFGSDCPVQRGLTGLLINLVERSVRADLDERLLLSAHNDPLRSRGIVTLTTLYRLPTDDEAELSRILAAFGRGSGKYELHRLPEGKGGLPIRARVEVGTSLLLSREGESILATHQTVVARALLLQNRRPRARLSH